MHPKYCYDKEPPTDGIHYRGTDDNGTQCWVRADSPNNPRPDPERPWRKYRLGNADVYVNETTDECLVRLDKPPEPDKLPELRKELTMTNPESVRVELIKAAQEVVTRSMAWNKNEPIEEVVKAAAEYLKTEWGRDRRWEAFNDLRELRDKTVRKPDDPKSESRDTHSPSLVNEEERLRKRMRQMMGEGSDSAPVQDTGIHTNVLKGLKPDATVSGDFIS